MLSFVPRLARLYLGNLTYLNKLGNVQYFH